MFKSARVPRRAEWLGTESNRRHADFQSAALPTELPSLKPFNLFGLLHPSQSRRCGETGFALKSRTSFARDVNCSRDDDLTTRFPLPRRSNSSDSYRSRNEEFALAAKARGGQVLHVHSPSVVRSEPCDFERQTRGFLSGLGNPPRVPRPHVLPAATAAPHPHEGTLPRYEDSSLETAGRPGNRRARRPSDFVVCSRRHHRRGCRHRDE